LKPAQVDALVAGYRSGSTMKDLAGEFGVDRRTVSTYLRRAEVPVRRGGLDHDDAIEGLPAL
jgi:predicted DNA binding protein